MKFSKITAIAAFVAAGISSAAMAQAVGDTVYGPDGNEVGKIEALEGGNVTINTGNITTVLPADVLGEGTNGPVIGWNKADLEAAVTAAQQEAAAALDAALVVGAAVQTADPQPLGTIDTIDGDNVVLVRTDESKVTLPKNLFAVDGSGNLMALLTMEQLDAALSAQTEG